MGGVDRSEELEAALPPPVPRPGDRVGRFEVIGELGRGGMGTVLAAHDPRLERRVALKLVAPAPRSADGGTEARTRLLREAQAMARLRHPNVVSVFEAGEHGGQIYLAMEEVGGGTLRSAVAALHRGGVPDWQAVLALFGAAARGLAAAHAAGLVHRDFKPENVLVDRGGRVAVGDFGLVAPEATAAPAAAAADTPLYQRVTTADVVLGTPAYMAPEQGQGRPVDGRADQFSFCVALYEALYGELPFAGGSRERYHAEILAGRVRPPRRDRRVPTWLHQVLARGLRADPAARYESMEELLVELGLDPEHPGVPGRAERTVATAGGVIFIVMWALTVLLLDVELTYPLHYATDGVFLLFILVLAILARDAVARTRFNRQVVGFGLTGAISVLVLTFGCHILGISAADLGALHLLVLGVLTLGASATLDPWIGIAAVTYLAGFLVSAAWPQAFLHVCLISHSVLAVVLARVFRGR